MSAKKAPPEKVTANKKPVSLQIKVLFDSTKKANTKGAHAIGCKN
ncbi:MAG: hypothetical protein QXN69_07285 [Candidatus Methanomethylicaceae archaeon]